MGYPSRSSGLEVGWFALRFGLCGSRWWSACGRNTTGACHSAGSHQHRLMLPLVIGASQHQEFFTQMHTPARWNPASMNAFPEVQALSVRMEHISRAAFLQMLRHALKCGEEEVIKLLVFHGIVLDGQTTGTFEGNAIGRVRHDEIGLPAVHEQSHILAEVASPHTRRCRPIVQTSPCSTKRAFSSAAVRSNHHPWLRCRNHPQTGRASSLLVKAGEQGIKVHALQRPRSPPQTPHPIRRPSPCGCPQ